jgi:hypothetical protein
MVPKPTGGAIELASGLNLTCRAGGTACRAGSAKNISVTATIVFRNTLILVIITLKQPSPTISGLAVKTHLLTFCRPGFLSLREITGVLIIIIIVKPVVIPPYHLSDVELSASIANIPPTPTISGPHKTIFTGTLETTIQVNTRRISMTCVRVRCTLADINAERFLAGKITGDVEFEKIYWVTVGLIEADASRACIERYLNRRGIGSYGRPGGPATARNST